jgi:cation-transporting ATPase F
MYLPPRVARENRVLYGHLTLTALQAIDDPPRKAAAAALRVCHDAGVAVKMMVECCPDHRGGALLTSAVAAVDMRL